MRKEEIKEQVGEALKHIAKAYSILQAIKTRANDILKNDNGKDIEREYNSAYNALMDLENAKRELSTLDL